MRNRRHPVIVVSATSCRRRTRSSERRTHTRRTHTTEAMTMMPSSYHRSYTRPSSPFSFHPRHRHLFFSLLPLLLLVQPVFGQVSTVTHSPFTYPPDFTEIRTVLPLIACCTIVPYFTITLFFIWRRRHHYPLAGRGSTYLLILNGLCVVGGLWQNLCTIVYPEGLPCALQFISIISILVPICITYMCRAWILAFRLEIMNYLSEMRWRGEKVTLRQQRRLEKEETDINTKQGDEQANETGDTTTTTATAVGVTRIKVDEEEEEVDTDPTKIPGYWFIAHRQYTESRYLNRFIYGTILTFIIGIILLANFDPDIYLFDQSFHSRGLLSEDISLGSQFTIDGFFNGAPCLLYSIKMCFFIGSFGCIAIPMVTWVVWRMFLDTHRRKERAKEKDDLLGKDHREKKRKDDNQQHHTNATKRSKVKKGMDLDESTNVKIELFCIVNLGIWGISLYFPIQAWATGWSPMVQTVVYIVAHHVSIILPLRLSYAMSRQHRTQIHGLGGVGGGVGGSRTKSGESHSKVGPIDQQMRLPHLRPFYSPKFILRHPETYPILLAFLQKEYSSENALFWSESRQFEYACREMELRIPTWPRSLGGEEGSGGTAGGGGGGVGGASGVGSGLMTMTRQIRSQIGVIQVGGGGGMNLKPPPPSSQLQPQPPTATTTPTPISIDTITSPSSPMSPIDATPTPTTPAAATANVGLPNSPKVMVMSPTSSVTQHAPLSSNVSLPHRPTHHHYASETMLPGIPSMMMFNNGIGLHPDGTPETYETLQDLHAHARSLKLWSSHLYHSYLERSSMFEINIPEDLSKLVASQIRQLETWEPTPQKGEDGSKDESDYPLPPPFPISTLYKQTNHVVFELIASDSFRRFILTPEFGRLLEKANEEEVLRLEQQRDLQLDTKAIIERAMEQLNQGGGSPMTPARSGVGGNPGGGSGVAGVTGSKYMVASPGTPIGRSIRSMNSGNNEPERSSQRRTMGQPMTIGSPIFTPMSLDNNHHHPNSLNQ